MQDENWRCEYFESGTCLVTRDRETEPHFYVHGPRNDDPVKRQRKRVIIAEELRDWLNGGRRPEWFAGLEPDVAGCAVRRSCGILIYARGPDEGAHKRASLLRTLFTEEPPK